MTATTRVEGFAASPKRSVSQNGTTLFDVGVAHNSRTRNWQTGEWSNKLDRDGNPIRLWVNARFYGDNAELLAEQITDGTYIELEGEPELAVFTKQDGTPGYRFELQHAKLRIVPRRPRRSTTGGPYDGPPADDPWQNVGTTDQSP